LSTYDGGLNSLLCASGTVAVELALRGLGVTAGDEVILAGYDFPGNFRSIEAIGARPVLVDLDDDRWTIGPDSISSAVTAESKAVIVSHLHGDMAPISDLIETSHRHGLAVLEDACQATGAIIDGRRAGTLGDVGVVSFGGSKLLTAGRGGAILSRRADVIQRAKICNERGNEAYPLSELQAAVLLPQLKKLDERNLIRRRNVKHLLAALRDVNNLTPVRIDQPNVEASFYKLAWRYTTTGGRSRDEFLRRAIALDLAMGDGFRGFFRRSQRRCRTVGTLPNCRIAADQTVLLHHPMLLGPVQSIQDTADRIRRALTDES
jgi:dTDP-4-amino-4,6-dideoxygalactose transaminase